MYELTAVSMQQQILKMDSAAENISNAHTPGYKSRKMDVVFENLLSSVALSSIDYRDSSPGKMALDSRLGAYSVDSGFFVVKNPNSQFEYKKSIVASVDDNGALVSESGAHLQGSNGSIFVGDKEFTIAGNGAVLVDGLEIDKLSFSNSANGIITTDQIDVTPGFIEQSNVKLSSEVQIMLEASRKIQSLQSGVARYDRLISMINDFVRDVK